ncbi:MAG: PilZ domain-containing protein [Planctomycetota bacterium]
MGTPDDSAPRRRDDRYEHETYAGVSTHRAQDNEHTVATVMNVSRRGLCLRSNVALTVGELVSLRIAAGEQLHRLPAVVRRVNETEQGVFEVGLEFDPGLDTAPAFLEATMPVSIHRVARG